MFVCLEPAAKYKLVLRQVLLLLCQQPFWGSGGWVDQGASWQPQENAKQTLELFGILKRLPKAPLVTQPPLPQKADGAVEKDLSQYQHVFQSRF